jgi:O-acetyl-ADP-ribose deacetylase (regulator of RNase III)
MNGGVDAVIKRHLGAGIQLRVRKAIRAGFGAHLPIGSAVCVPSGAFQAIHRQDAAHPGSITSVPDHATGPPLMTGPGPSFGYGPSHK